MRAVQEARKGDRRDEKWRHFSRRSRATSVRDKTTRGSRAHHTFAARVIVACEGWTDDGTVVTVDLVCAVASHHLGSAALHNKRQFIHSSSSPILIDCRSLLSFFVRKNVSFCLFHVRCELWVVFKFPSSFCLFYNPEKREKFRFVFCSFFHLISFSVRFFSPGWGDKRQ